MGSLLEIGDVVEQESGADCDGADHAAEIHLCHNFFGQNAGAADDIGQIESDYADVQNRYARGAVLLKAGQLE